MMDEHEGKGGSYIRDPETGARKLVERTAERPAGEPEKPAKENKSAKSTGNRE